MGPSFLPAQGSVEAGDQGNGRVDWSPGTLEASHVGYLILHPSAAGVDCPHFIAVETSLCRLSMVVAENTPRGLHQTWVHMPCD